MKAKILGAKGTVYAIDGVEFKAGDTVDVTPEQLRRLGADAEVIEEKKGGTEK